MNRSLRVLHQGVSWVKDHHLLRRGRELELMHRAMGFATLALVTLAPLLIVVAAADPLQRGGFSSWLADGMGLSGRSAKILTDISSPPSNVVNTTSVWGGIALAVFGVSFAGSVQNGYERIWNLPPGPWHKIWRQAAWLAALTVYLYQEAQTRVALSGPERIALSSATGIVFFWWGQYFLLGGQVRWLHLLPGSVATMVGLVGLRGFSYVVFTPLIVDNAVSYGTVGIVLVVESWLIGVGFVVYGGSMFGHWLYAHHLWNHPPDAELSPPTPQPPGPDPGPPRRR
ncbi:ribonuclease BN [Streptomyces sp. NPDC014006]|uniref:ribonuclease BN n=1 Tax=Streptomyces sp. NPDC014006 TaxID=3364870 RepID=UPI0037001209